MNKIIIIVVLLCTGNIGFSLESQDFDTSSKLQKFVSRVFEYYDLPLPETEEFPGYEDFELTNYNQEKPEFSIMTTPIGIQPHGVVAHT